MKYFSSLKKKQEKEGEVKKKQFSIEDDKAKLSNVAQFWGAAASLSFLTDESFQWIFPHSTQRACSISNDNLFHSWLDIFCFCFSVTFFFAQEKRYSNKEKERLKQNTNHESL